MSSSDLPAGWTCKESKSRAGKLYYINGVTGETTWTIPTAPAEGPPGGEVQVLHLLKKHSGSRRPASWRCENITQSKEVSIQQITAYREQLVNTMNASGVEAMVQQFKEIAYQESDCGSHERGGDLGMFGRGKMQKPFEEASFALNVGELSGLVDTDSECVKFMANHFNWVRAHVKTKATDKENARNGVAPRNKAKRKRGADSYDKNKSQVTAPAGDRPLNTSFPDGEGLDMF